MNKKTLFAIPAMVAVIVTGSALVAFTPNGNDDVLGNNNLVIIRDTDLEEKIFDKIVHDHSLDSRRAIVFNEAIDSRFDFQDRLILNSLNKHELTLAKRILFAELLDENEVLLKKKLLFNAIHEFDSHNFHDFDHDLHLGSGLQFQDFVDDLNTFHDHDELEDDGEDCMNVWVRHNLLQRICN